MRYDYTLPAWPGEKFRLSKGMYCDRDVIGVEVVGPHLDLQNVGSVRMELHPDDEPAVRFVASIDEYELHETLVEAVEALRLNYLHDRLSQVQWDLQHPEDAEMTPAERDHWIAQAIAHNLLERLETDPLAELADILGDDGVVMTLDDPSAVHDTIARAVGEGSEAA